MSSTSAVQNQVRLFRVSRGWSQHELATRASVSRIEVSAIEVGRVVPSVAAALALARAFHCGLDDLFQVPDATGNPPEWGWQPRFDRCRFWESEVYGRRLLYPAETAFPWSHPHDGLCEFGVFQCRRKLPPSQTLVVACCDPAAGLLAAEYARTTDYRMIVIPRSSGVALSLLAERKVHLAGVHLQGAGESDGNAQTVRSRLGTGYSLLHVARWQEGLVVARGTKSGSVESAVRSRLRWVEREPGSGARQCLDEIRPGKKPPAHVASDHRAVAEAIRSGWADVGVCVRLVSEEAGLRFLKVREESYDLCCPQAAVADARFKALIRVLRSPSYRELIAELPGYATERTGEIRNADSSRGGIDGKDEIRMKNEGRNPKFETRDDAPTRGGSPRTHANCEETPLRTIMPGRLPLLIAGCLLWFLGCQSGDSESARPKSNPGPAARSDAERSESDRRPRETQVVRIAAASDLRFALDELTREFATIEPGIELRATFGSSGSFFAQLSNEAPFDLFLSADIELPRKLIRQGQGVAESEFEYGVGGLVLWVPDDSPLRPEEGVRSVLAGPGVVKIAIANPEHAPYGRAAVSALKTLELYEATRDRLVLAENVSQALQWVDSGAADVGLVAASLVLAPSMKERGRFVPVPREAYPPLGQGGVILKWAAAPGAAEAFRTHMLSESGQAILHRYGFRRRDE